MNPPPSEALPRILIVDDNPAIHEDFRKILGAKSNAQSRLENVEAALFGESASPLERAGFRIDSAHQGKEALELVQKAIEDGDPYVMAFVDVRMPPGWDGIKRSSASGNALRNCRRSFAPPTPIIPGTT